MNKKYFIMKDIDLPLENYEMKVTFPPLIYSDLVSTSVSSINITIQLSLSTRHHIVPLPSPLKF